MALQSYADQMLAVLRPLYADWDLWVVHCLRPVGDIWCARRKGEPTACVNADSPEELIEAIRQLETQ